MSTTPGKFLTFEGVDASGKTTNVSVLADHLRERGYKVITTREPGGTRVGDKVRNILLEQVELDVMHPTTELLLFLAARNEHVEKIVRPHLEKGYIVICDRFHDSTWAYQGYARGMLPQLESLRGYVNADILPSYTLFFNLPFEESARRLALRTGQQDRLDMEEEDFRRRVYSGYQKRFHEVENTILEPGRKIVHINALPELEEVSASVKAWANSVFENLT